MNFGFAIVANSMPSDGGSGWNLKNLVDGIIDTVDDGAWPAYDLF